MTAASGRLAQERTLAKVRLGWNPDGLLRTSLTWRRTVARPTAVTEGMQMAAGKQPFDT